MEKHSAALEIAALTNSIKREMSHSLKSVAGDLTGMQVWIICYIAAEAPCREVLQRDVETSFNITRPTASGILQRMERDGLILRQKSIIDGRQKQLILTAKTRALCDYIKDLSYSVDAKMTKGIASEKIQIFFEVLAAIKVNLAIEK